MVEQPPPHNPFFPIDFVVTVRQSEGPLIQRSASPKMK